MSLIILGTVFAGICIVRHFDRAATAEIRIRPGILAAGLLGSGILWQSYSGKAVLLMSVLAVILGCLLFACVTDTAICQVYNFTWWVAEAAGAVLFWNRCGHAPDAARGVLQLSLFCIVQLLVFVRMYGRGDCYAFCVCAVAEAGLGMGFLGFLIHMTIAFVLLVFVQSLNRNIGPGGRLKIPVPFLPYITAAFYLVLVLKGFRGIFMR